MNALISASQLQQQKQHMQVLEVGVKTAVPEHAELASQQYLQGHIPSAQYADLTRYFSHQDTLLDYQHPQPDELHRSLCHFHLRQDQPIVLYDRENHIWAARLWWVLKAYGFEQVYLLNGGLKAWMRQGGVLESGPYLPNDLAFQEPDKLHLNPHYFADQHLVEQVVAGQHEAILLNVLREVVYLGVELRYHRRGHIPGSINIPFQYFLDHDGFFKASISSFEAEFGLDFNREIIIYCGSGITASGAAFALTQAGVSQVKIYDGSMSEWSANPDLPLTVLV